jgi:hypothetical protein
VPALRGGSLRCHDAFDLSSSRPSCSPAFHTHEAAHAGKVHALCLGPGGLVYSGGDDGWVRAWTLDSATGALTPAGRYHVEGGGGDGDGDGGGSGDGGGDGGGVGVRALCAVRHAVSGECVGLAAGDSEGGLSLWMA